MRAPGRVGNAHVRLRTVRPIAGGRSSEISTHARRAVLDRSIRTLSSVSTTMRTARPDDHDWIVGVVDDWWGRAVSTSVPRLFLDHFHSTSLVAELDREPVGFLIGFASPSVPTVAYIHFVGVDPAHRTKSLGRQLYHRFFELVRGYGCLSVWAITNAVNDDSIAFHRRMGFEVSDPIEGYDRPGIAHVRFTRRI